ncbi:hypothetical protein BDW59DRAFT_170616 [Aspergillus cavernicola]|uniref:Zn(2)-C6 fungal-type domain-containing protein n=1 Tax=Aspergillus cavernicola TaxID=176166 RepID=A0ABR4IPL6_9EURO
MQSCDICRKRKVKCDRHTPCARCRRLRQQCTYTDILRKKGPKFVHTYPRIYACVSRAMDVDMEMGMAALPVLANLGMGLGSGSGSGSGTGTVSEGTSETGFDMELELDLGLDPGEASVVDTLGGEGFGSIRGGGEGAEKGSLMADLALYVETLYPLLPVVDLREIYPWLRSPLIGGDRGRSDGHGHSHGHSLMRNAFLSSLRAAVHAHFSLSFLDGREGVNEHEHVHVHACERFLRDALHARGQYDTAEVQSQHEHTVRHRLLSSFFLSMTYWSLRREKYAWWYLRECIALLLSCRMHHEDEYRRLEPREAEFRRRVFWGGFVIERTFCLLHDKPMTLRPWIEPPSFPNAFDEEGVMSGFVRLVTVFQGVGVDLSGCWTAAGFVTPVTLTLIEHDGMEADLPIQSLDLAITREWLRVKRWKLGIPQQRSSSEFVASKENPNWRLDEPLLVGKATLGALQGSADVLGEIWGTVLDQKLYDICECLYDILPVMQRRGPAGELDLEQVLRGLLEGLSRFRGRSAYLLSHAHLLPA